MATYRLQILVKGLEYWFGTIDGANIHPFQVIEDAVLSYENEKIEQERFDVDFQAVIPPTLDIGIQATVATKCNSTQYREYNVRSCSTQTLEQVADAQTQTDFVVTVDGFCQTDVEYNEVISNENITNITNDGSEGEENEDEEEEDDIDTDDGKEG